MTINKAYLIESINSQFKFSKNRSAKLIDSIIEILKGSLEIGDDIMITGFGKFAIKQRNNGRGRSPAADGNGDLQAGKVLRFKCSPVLMNKMNKNGDE